MSYHAPSSSKSRSNSTSETQRKTRVVWEFEDHLTGSINNSVLLTSLNLTRSNESSVEPRVGISNNDGTVRLYDVPLRVQNSRRRLKEVGVVELDVPINHCECFFCSICFLLLSGFFLLAPKNAIRASQKNIILRSQYWVSDLQRACNRHCSCTKRCWTSPIKWHVARSSFQPSFVSSPTSSYSESPRNLLVDNHLFKLPF